MLPLHGSAGEWGSGTVLVITNNVKVVPISNTSKVTVGPLSIKESSKLIGQIAGYTLSSEEEILLMSTVEKRQWRLIPLVMARWDFRNLMNYTALISVASFPCFFSIFLGVLL